VLTVTPASCPDTIILGNIGEVGSIDELLESDRARTIQAEIDRCIAMCRTECEYFGICGGGSPGNKFYEHGTFAATETLKCALHPRELVEGGCYLLISNLTNRLSGSPSVVSPRCRARLPVEVMAM